MTDPESLLTNFGYLAVFVGTFLEGETILVAAGFFAERGHLNLTLVIVTAFLGSFVGHIFWFWLGRTKGVAWFKKYPKLEKHLGKGILLFERYGAPAIFISQWVYGIRISCAIIIGISRISIAKFLIYEALSCLLWSIVIAMLGFYFGRAIETLLGRAEHVEKWGLLFLVTVGIGFYLYHRWKEGKQSSETEA